MGCITTLPNKYHEKMEKLGIKCQVFNKFIPILSIIVNNRDHRKITVIDGHTAFTGGINLADEYINEVVRFGHWKDASIMIKGEAVWNLTVMFLQVWNFIGFNKEDYNKYRPKIYHLDEFGSDGPYHPRYGTRQKEKIIELKRNKRYEQTENNSRTVVGSLAADSLR